MSILPQYNGYIVQQSTTKLRLRRLKTKATCTFCFRNNPTGKIEQTFAPCSPSHLEETNLVINFDSTITKLLHVLILLLTEIPQPGKQGKCSPRLPATQKPRISPSLQLGWTITKSYMYQFTSRPTQHKPYS